MRSRRLPAPAGGVVYVGGAGSGGTLYAVNENTGHSSLDRIGQKTGTRAHLPSVRPGSTLSYACAADIRFLADVRRSDLALLDGLRGRGWAELRWCYDGSLYVRTTIPAPPPVLSAASGAQTGTFDR